MRVRSPKLTVDDDRAKAGLDQLKAELEIATQYPPELVGAAEQAVAAPDEFADQRTDRTDIELVTVDPASSTDLDQALHVAPTATGFRVYYAIADVATFVKAGSPLDLEVHARGVTNYPPDGRIPLHPDAIGTQAASLMPDGPRPALLWTIDLDTQGQPTKTTFGRAQVRSREKLSYEKAQELIDSGSPPAALSGLKQVGELRRTLEAQRGGISLTQPSQEIVTVPGGYELKLVGELPVENWNAQISLLCGMEAGRIMLEGKVGLLRTMPKPDAKAIEPLRRCAAALGIQWPADQPYGEFVRSLDPTTAIGSALMTQAARTLRGSGYTAFNGSAPEEPIHGAIAAPYAHVTAPIRRLSDRITNETVLALSTGKPVPDWVKDGLEATAEAMQAASKRANALDRGCLDLIEALLLADHIGAQFEGTVIDTDDRGSLIQLHQPPVLARAKGAKGKLGETVTATVLTADPIKRQVTLEI